MNKNQNQTKHEQLWQTVLGELEVIISRASFTTWFKDTGVYKIKKEKAIISVPNCFTKEWLKNKYNKLIINAVQNNLPQIKILEYEIRTPVYIKTERPKQRQEKNQEKITTQDIDIKHPTGLSSRYNFNSFVSGSSNELAYAACSAVSENPGKLYNPVFIYGGVGLGKTHLLQAVGNTISNKNKNCKICYIPAEKFTNDYVDAIKQGTIKEFKTRYRDSDVLLVDDIQFIAGKEKTQDEFFHTFNTLYGSNKQIILTSDRPPKAIPTIEERLRSRFEGGMIADISFPDLETRLAILKTKTDEKSFELSNNIIEYIAQNIQNNIRELEGALNKILAHADLKGQTPTITEVEKLLQGTILPQKNKITNTKQILKIVAEFYDVSIRDIIQRSRKRKIVKPRQIAMFLMREEMQASYPSIGEEFDNRDHTTAIHAYEKVLHDKKEKEDLRQELNIIKQRLYCV